MRMLWARQTKLGLAIETTLRRAKPRCPWDLAHWVADPPERPTVADVSAVLTSMLEHPAPPVTWPKGIPDLSAIKLTMARQVRSALAEGDDRGALDGMRDLAAVDMADGTTYAAFLSLLQATNGSVLAAARSAIRPRVVMHVSCLPRLDRARRSAGSFAVAESRGVSQVLVVGAPDNDQFRFDASSNVLTVPAPDTYEHLPEKVVAALTFLSMCGNVEAVLKVDDDHRLKSWGELERGFRLVQRDRPQQIGKLTDVGWPGMHRRAWHFVGHELGMTCAFERKHTRDHRQTGLRDPFVELLKTHEVEDRPGHDELGARFDLVLEAAELFIEVRRRGIHRHTDVERGRGADGLTAQVAAVVETRDDVGETD